MTEKKSELDNIGLLQFLWNWRKPILIITLAGAVASTVVSLMMPVYYKATAVIAPTKTTSVQFGPNAKNNIAEFGDEDDALRLMLILESPEIRDSLTLKYNLFEHYDIDTATESNFRYKFQEIYSQNVSFDRTKENAIEINVYDKEPEIARDMANDIVRLVDTVMNRMIRRSALPRLYSVQHEVALIRQEMSDYSDRLKELRDSGVVAEEERRDLYTNYLEAKQMGDLETAKDLKRKIDAVEKYGSDFDLYTNLADGFSERYVNILDDNDQAKQFAQNEVRQSHVRNYAELPDKKAKPKRMIIVLISTLAAFFFACVSVILLVRIKELRAASK